MTNKSDDVRLLLRIYKAQQLKSAQARELEVYQAVKEAAIGGLSLANMASLAKKIPTSSLGKGLAWGTGLAIPGYIAGKELVDYGTDEARNKALQVAGGAAALGTALYGLHRLMSPPQKQAMYSSDILEKKLEKLASAFYLDTVLESGSLDETLTKKGSEDLFNINKRYIGSLILDLLQ